MTASEKIASLCRHIGDVQKNCRILGDRLIRRKQVNLGRTLIANGLSHDASKFQGIEWACLNPKASDKKLKEAISFHNTNNKHHPEYWGDIHKMPDEFVAEMVCDWSARSGELGTSLRQWIDGPAMTRYGYTKKDPVYRKIRKFMKLLCEEFKPLPTTLHENTPGAS